MANHKILYFSGMDNTEYVANKCNTIYQKTENTKKFPKCKDFNNWKPEKVYDGHYN